MKCTILFNGIKIGETEIIVTDYYMGVANGKVAWNDKIIEIFENRYGKTHNDMMQILRKDGLELIKDDGIPVDSVGVMLATFWGHKEIEVDVYGMNQK